MKRIPLDAIPDLSDVQVIVYTPWEGRSPDLIEDQVTYPIVTALDLRPEGQGRARALGFRLLLRLRHLRGRHRHLLGAVAGARVPAADHRASCRRRRQHRCSAPTPPGSAGCSPTPWWTRPASTTSATLRTLQDWYVRYALAQRRRRGRGRQRRRVREAVPGQHRPQPPGRLRHLASRTSSSASAAPTTTSRAACSSSPAASTWCAAAATSSRSRTSSKIALGTNERGTPILLRDIAEVGLGPDIRRGIVELDGRGEVAGGIVVMRLGENALTVIDARQGSASREIEPGLPDGVQHRADLRPLGADPPVDRNPAARRSSRR